MSESTGTSTDHSPLMYKDQYSDNEGVSDQYNVPVLSLIFLLANYLTLLCSFPFFTIPTLHFINIKFCEMFY